MQKIICLKKLNKRLKITACNLMSGFRKKHCTQAGDIDRAIKLLQEHNFIYEHERALWFASTKFGDDKDRVVRKSSANGPMPPLILPICSIKQNAALIIW